jgi:hypothetical protein
VAIRKEDDKEPVIGEFDVKVLLEIDPVPVGPTEEEFPRMEKE